MKKNFICLLAVICMMLCVSCERYSGVSRPNDIYAYWQLQNEVKFNGMGFTNLIFTSSYENFVDPVISDTIYHYKWRATLDIGYITRVRWYEGKPWFHWMFWFNRFWWFR